MSPRPARAPAGTAGTTPSLPAPSARVVWWEIGIVLALSLGRSGVYAIVELIEKATRGPLSDQVTAMNPSRADREYFDLTYQLLDIAFALVPVVLVLHLVFLRGRNPFRSFGLDFRRFLPDVGWGLTLFLGLGVGTLVVYAAGRAAGVTTAIVGSAMNEYWWTTPVLILSALRHSLLEEVIVIAWLFDRLGYLQQLRAARRDSGGGAAGGGGAVRGRPVDVATFRTTATGAFLPLNAVTVVLACAVLRATYHLYQGLGPGVGNLAMGVIFGIVYLRYRRVMPLVVAHLLLDVAGFAAYPLLAQLGWLGV